MAQDSSISMDPKSGFCNTNSIFYSKRQPLLLPSNESLDITTFISSQPHHGKIAFIDSSTGHHLTYTQLWRLVDSVASGLSNLGIRKGHVVLILSPNSIFFPIICLSVMSLGAIITTTNPLNTAREIGVQISDSKPILAFTTQSLLPKLAYLNDLPIVLIGEKDNSDSNATIVSTLDEMMMMKKEPIQNLVKHRVNQDDTASLLYSSGTTGESKGVALSHGNLIAMVQHVATQIHLLSGKQTLICTVPMFHVYGFGWFAVALLASGSTVVVLSKFDLDEMLSAVSKYSVMYLTIVPPVLITLINNADRIRSSSRYNLGSLKWIVSGGAPLSKEVSDEFLALYPNVKILQGYGLTETSGVGALNDPVEDGIRYGSAGLLAASFEAKIVDPDNGNGNGDALGVNHVGELWLHGPYVMKGYLNNPEATASTLDSEGWLKTGDLCYIDDDGYLFVIDRLKDLIKYKAYQVPPAELEAVLLTHPQIADAAVIPFPDKEVGQFPMAYVVRKEVSDLSENAVMDFVASQVAPYKKIRRVTFVDSIPKSPSGKILRKNLIKLTTSKL